MTSVETYQEAVGRYVPRMMATRPGEKPWLVESRRSAAARFLETGFPTEKDETWRYTDLSPTLQVPFRIGLEAQPRMVESLLKEVVTVPGARRLVFVNGRYRSDLSQPGDRMKGVRLGGLAEALAAGFKPSEAAWEQSALGHTFTDLNTALFEDGAFLALDPGVILKEPVQLVYLTTASAEPCEAHPRNLILLGEGAQAVVIESHLGGPGPHLSNSLTQADLSQGSVLSHARLQEESLFTGHSFGALVARQAADSRLWSGLASLGGYRVRHEAVVRFHESGAECSLDGAYLSRCRQHVDCRTFVDHAVPNCTSNQVYKGVLDGKSSGVFEGRVLVRENAQKTDARQSNKNLLLSQEAQAYSKPQLEIYANDVKCSHGSATGPVDGNALFYLRSRGLPLVDARRMLVRAFVGEVLERFKPETWVDALKGRMKEWLIRPEDVGETSN